MEGKKAFALLFGTAQFLLGLFYIILAFFIQIEFYPFPFGIIIKILQRSGDFYSIILSATGIIAAISGTMIIHEWS